MKYDLTLLRWLIYYLCKVIFQVEECSAEFVIIGLCVYDGYVSLIYIYIYIFYIFVLTDLYWDMARIASTFNAYRNPDSAWNVLKVPEMYISEELKNIYNLKVIMPQNFR